METIKLFARYKSRKLTANEYIEYSKNILLGLKSIHPIFETLYGWGTTPTAWALCDPQSQNFDNVLFKQISDDNYAYINIDREDKKLHLDSYSYIGFLNTYSNTKNEKEGKIKISISDGEGVGIGYINMEFPKANYPVFYTKEFCRKLLITCLDLAPIEHGVILSETLKKKIPQIDKKYWIGYITYFHRDLMENNTKLQKEFINGSGTIIYLSSDNYKQTTPQDIKESFDLREEITQDKIAMAFLNNILK